MNLPAPLRPLAACLSAALLGGFLPLEAAGNSGKERFLPERIGRVPEGNDFEDEDSEFAFARMVEGDNIAIFWSKEYGDNPREDPPPGKRFDPRRMLEESERYFRHYVDELKLVEKGDSISDRHKLLMFVFGGDEGTAYGGGIDDRVGAFWTPAVRVNREPYGVIAHEMGHSFQFYSRVDSGTGPRGPIGEMSAQFFLWQVLPEWMTFENYHLVDFMKKTHFAFLHPTNMYHSPYVLEYWSMKHGRDFYGELSRETRRGEDPVMTYKRLHDLSQEDFNDEMFDACRRFITWDLTRVDEVAKPYRNQHTSWLEKLDDSWFQISRERCIQNYGYNGIRLEAPDAGSEVRLEFEGLAGAEGFAAVRVDDAGWRYGFVASLEDGGREYSGVFRDDKGEASFTVPEDTEHLWLVVMGAPEEHWPVADGQRRGDDAPAEAEWPYRFRLEGATVDPGFVE